MTRVIKFYKPDGVLSAFTDAEGHATLSGYIPMRGVYSAGRLDLDSEGLLLLTDDGSLIHQLTDPRFAHWKTYLVLVEGLVTATALQALAEGVDLKGYRTLPARVVPISKVDLPDRARPVTPHGPTAWLKIEIREGKKRQVRHMAAAVGLPALRLIRIAIGDIPLGSLQPGEWQELSTEEISLLPKGPLRGQSSKK